ncbi:hypothetical protein BR1R3_47810 [Pseudomonas atacamensis]|uniref:hypothetical protein n=1 Tax=Pseudomonas atacamensis TaxID=2565368 RepID=UPI0022C35972|nr:hypothetical protein [Pseudomonas atacamensis]GLH22039.1 hypothetical protein BR1R3_47810 [Pseudomonas atacamensis]
MSSAPYYDKNAELTAAITRQLNDALRRLEKDSALSASASSLAKLSGVHRNTIYNRKWPLEKLNEIKTKRAQQKEEEACSKRVKRSPEELLELSRLEVIYWFTQLQDARNLVASLTKKARETQSSRDFYMSLALERLTKNNEQAAEISKLRDAVDLLEQELNLLKDK